MFGKPQKKSGIIQAALGGVRSLGAAIGSALRGPAPRGASEGGVATAPAAPSSPASNSTLPGGVPGGPGISHDAFAHLLADPDNQNIDLIASDFKRPPALPPWADSDEEKALVAFVRAFTEESAKYRRVLEREWVLALAQTQARQWLGWDDATWRTTNLMDEDEQDKYITDPLIIPLLRQWAALVTTTAPDCNALAQTQAPKDTQAADQANAYWTHLSRLIDLNLLNQERSIWAATTGAHFAKMVWNPQAYADIPTFGPDGQVSGRTAAIVGEMDVTGCPSFEVFLQPHARKWENVQRLVHARVQSISEIEDDFNLPPGFVKADQSDALKGYLDPWTNYAFGGAANNPTDSGQGLNAERGNLTRLEYWEAPSKRFPRITTGKNKTPGGRLIVIAGSRLLYRGPLPVDMQPTRNMPIPGWDRLVYSEAPDHPYGRGAVNDLIPLQVGYNRLLTKIVNRIEDEKLTVAVPNGTKTDPDAFEEIEEGRRVRKIRFDAEAGPPPAFINTPTTSEDVWRLREVFYGDMQTLMGIHDPSLGEPSAEANSGIAIELVQQADRSVLKLFLDRLLASAQNMGQQCITGFAHNAVGELPRMMGLDPSANPGTGGAHHAAPSSPAYLRTLGYDNSGDMVTAAAAAQTFEAMTGGGNVVMYCAPGSNLPKTPASEDAEIRQDFEVGLLDPMNPAARVAQRLMKRARSSEVSRWMEIELARAQKEQQDMMAQQQQAEQAAAVQQNQMQMAQNAQQAQLKAQTTPPQAAPPPGPGQPGGPPDPMQLEGVKQQGALLRDIINAKIKGDDNIKQALLDHHLTQVQNATQAALQPAPAGGAQ